MVHDDWNLLVIVIDRLNAGMLGPYGNTWIPTRAFNRLAGESWLSEFHFTTSSQIWQTYRSWWRGLHPLAPDRAGESLIDTWRAAGKFTLLVTDAAEVANLPDAERFDDKLEVQIDAVEQSAAGTDETQFAQLIGAAMERLESLPPKFALWLHARGLSAAWDAPAELREHLRDDEDPEAATFVEPPALRLAEDYDPDDLVPITQAYAAQVLAIDEALEALFEALTTSGRADNTVVVLTSPRGYLLGQQRYVGAAYDALLEDLLHVPLLVRYPGELHASERDLALLEPRDLLALLRAPGTWSPPQRDRLVMAAPTERAIRTAAWHLRMQESTAPELFAKPDDRYEVNNVAGRCQQIIADLEVTLAETTAAIVEQTESQLPPLAHELVDVLR